MMTRIALALMACAVLLPAQKYSGPRPPKPDVPYLLHADNLVETEIAEASEEKRKDDLAYIIAGASSPVKTPLAGTIFLFLASKIVPEKLQLYKLEVKNGRREAFFSQKKRKESTRPMRLAIARVGEGLFRIEVNETLANGEYSLSPDGSNQVFCFQVY